MAAQFGEDSRTRLQVEVRNLSSFGEAGSSPEPLPCYSRQRDCGWRRQAGWRRPWYWGGSAKGLCSPGVVGCQFQGVSMTTLMLIKEHCQFCDHMLRWRASLQGKLVQCVASWNGQRLSWLEIIPFKQNTSVLYVFAFETMFLRIFLFVF